MKQFSGMMALAILLAVALPAAAQNDKPRKPAEKAAAAEEPASQPAPPKLETYEQQRSYYMGLEYGMAVRRNGLRIDVQALLFGVMDAFTQRRLLTAEQFSEVRAKYQAESEQVRARQAAQLKKLAEDNLAAGRAFLAGNKDAEGVKTTASGLQCKLIKKGQGAFPKATDIVAVRFGGWFIDGKQFAKPQEQPVNVKLDHESTPRGFAEGLQRMAVGSTYKLFIPSDLAFGEEGSRGMPPNATLVYEVELVDIVKVDPPAEEPKK